MSAGGGDGPPALVTGAGDGPPALVTGGTGFVGGLVLRALVASGRRVRAISRRPADHAGLAAAGAEPVAASLEDGEALARALDGCEVVYHAAGLNAMCLPDPAPLYRVNVEGTRRLLRAARSAGVRRVVLTSSAATLGGDGRQVMDESSRWAGPFTSHYARSKFEAEQVALGFDGLEVVALNPSSVQGPGRRAGTAKLFIDFLNGRLPFDVPSTFGMCFTDDCAAGHLLAESRGRAGERYVLNTTTLTNTEAIALVGELAGLADRPRTLPVQVAFAAGALSGAAGRLRRRRPEVCIEVIRTLVHAHRYDGSRAERELGLTYTPVRQAIERTLRWYVEEGLVTRPLPALA